MAQGLPAGYALPKPQLLRVTGVLDIVFASLLLCAGLVELIFLVAMPLLLDFAQVQIKTQQAAQQRVRQDEIDRLKADEAKAATPEEAAPLADRRAALEAEEGVPVPDTRDLLGVALDRRVQAYEYAKVVSALALNAFMLTAGVLLLRGAERGRRAGLWAAGLKIARLAALAVVGILVITPLKVEGARRAMEAINKVGAARGAPSGPTLTSQAAMMTAVSDTVQVIGLLVFGSIWPGIAIYLLTRPGARAAASVAAESPPPKPQGDSPWVSSPA